MSPCHKRALSFHMQNKTPQNIKNILHICNNICKEQTKNNDKLTFIIKQFKLKWE